MPIYVSLLRGVNVGGRHALPMAKLKVVFERAGCSDVRTFIQSGNVVFSSPAAPDLARLESALEQECGFAIPLVLRTGSAIRKVVESTPFADLDRTKLHVGFMAKKPLSRFISACDTDRFLPERFAFVGADLYLFLPHGMARTKLPGYLARQVGLAMTVRNWNTVTTLATMAEE